MKVLLITPFYSPIVSGSCRLLQDVVDTLIASGHVVEVLTYGPDPQRCRAFDSAQSYPIYRIQPRRLPGGSSLEMIARVLFLTRRGGYDIVFCGVAFPIAVLAYAAQFVTRVPYMIYSFGEDLTMVQGSRLKTALLARALRRARAILTISDFSRREAEKLGPLPKRVQCIPPGIDSEPYEQVSQESMEALRVRLGVQGKRLILTVARLTARKGHDMIIRALPELCRDIPDLHYLIVGDGDPQPLRALAEAGHVADRVTFVDYVPNADLPALYHLGDVYAMVSRWDPETKQVEGFGIVYLEAGACGKPCVAGSAGGAPDAVENGVTGFIVDPTNLDEITTALRTLLTESVLAQTMGAAAQARVREHFQKQILLARLEQTMEQAVSGWREACGPASS